MISCYHYAYCVEEQRNAISERQKGKNLSDEHKKKISKAMREHYGRL